MIKVHFQSGFTLTELLVTMTIMAILGIASFNILSDVQHKAKESKVQQDFRAMTEQIQIARQAKNKTFCQLTGQIGSNPACWSASDCYSSTTKIKDIPACASKLESSWSNFTDMKLPTDPWGDLYAFDENEYEPTYCWPGGLCGVGNQHIWCRQDFISSAGPDGKLGTGDDISYNIPPLHCKIKQQCVDSNPVDCPDPADPTAPSPDPVPEWSSP